MPTVTKNTIGIADSESGTLTSQTRTEEGLDVKNRHEGDEETSYIEGYAATTHMDSANDKFSEEALERLAENIRNDAESTVDAVLPHMEGMSESQIGNVNHNNNPAAQKLVGTDTRTVSVFKIVHAETRMLPDGETALFIRGELLPLPDDLEEAIKGQIREGALNGFSIEFNPTNVEFEVVSGKPVRKIHKAQAKGVALTGRPLNSKSEMTDAELKNILAKNAETSVDASESNVKTEDSTMPEEEDKEDKVEQNEGEEPENEPEEPEKGSGSSDSEESSEKGQEDGSDVDELKNDISELKNMFSELQDEKEELEQENEELKNKLEDNKTVQEIDEEISEIKNIIEDSGKDLEGDRPLADQEETRNLKNQGGDKPLWQKSIDQRNLSQDDLKNEIGKKGETEAQSIADTHGIKTQEVIDYAS